MTVAPRPLTRPSLINGVGRVVLRALERRLDRAALARLREWFWRGHVYIYVTPGELLVSQALAGFPADVRALGARCAFHRHTARGGGGYDPGENAAWLAAGVETYEGLAQVLLSACHELFHFICRNDPRYREDEDRGWTRLLDAVRRSQPLLDAYPRYRDWVTRSFLRQGDHANPAEFFADIPTNFRDPAELPPPLRGHFAPLINGSPFASLVVEPSEPVGELAEFQRLLAPELAEDTFGP